MAGMSRAEKYVKLFSENEDFKKNILKHVGPTADGEQVGILGFGLYKMSSNTIHKDWNPENAITVSAAVYDGEHLNFLRAVCETLYMKVKINIQSPGSETPGTG